MDTFWSDTVEAFRTELNALKAAGCTYVQIDETAFAKFGDPEVQAALAARGDAGGGPALTGGHPDYVPQACEKSLKMLGVDVIDIYGLHRVDKTVPIEDTVGAMKKLVEQGKVRHLQICEAGAQTIRRAHKVHPLVAVETEYSLWSRDVEKEILPACRELGIGYMAYSPLGRGFLTATMKTLDALIPKDRRREHPRFSPDNIAKNAGLLGPLEKLNLNSIDWVIVGGESGPGARPMKQEWVRQIRDRCLQYRVPFFFKQWGGVNKKRAGRVLDGRTWD